MIYLLQYIFFWLFAAAGVGALLAWYLRGAILNPKIAAACEERDQELAAGETLRAEIDKLRREAGVLENSAGTWSAKAMMWDREREKLLAELRDAAEKARSLERELAAAKSERETLLAEAAQTGEWRARFEDLRINAVAALAAPKAMAAAAAAGAASTVTSAGPAASVEDRFLSFVVRTQNEGWGDIERLEGLQREDGQRLRAVGIAWVKDLLSQAGSGEGLERVSREAGIPVDLLASWARAADLLRVDGITPAWARTLELAGVESVSDLARRDGDELMEQLQELDPGVGERLHTWIQRARKLQPKPSASAAAH